MFHVYSILLFVYKWDGNQFRMFVDSENFMNQNFVCALSLIWYYTEYSVQTTVILLTVLVKGFRQSQWMALAIIYLITFRFYRNISY